MNLRQRFCMQGISTLPTTQPANAPKILVVDDSTVNLALLRSMLEAEGFRTVTARDGASAREVGLREVPDLILLDVVMPGESGFATCAGLKSDSRTADIPVIFLSSLDDVKSKVQGLKTGGVDYVSKPVHPDEVLARVRVHLRIRANNQAIALEQKTCMEELKNAQRAILVRPSEIPGASFEVFYSPLRETGGDFYDVFALSPDVYGYFVADVSGHGAGAAFLTVAVKALLRQYSSPLFSPEDTMRGVDAVMRQMMGAEQYLTACYARLNRRTGYLTVVSAGHPPLIAVGPSGTARIVEMDSEPIGIFGTLTLQAKQVQLGPGERFYLFTDGLIEATAGAGRRAGVERLVEACVAHRGVPLREGLHGIVRAVRGEPGIAGPQSDDVLLLGVESCRC